MVKTPVFKGACTAIVTPFTEHGIDYERLGKNINYQYENGVSAIVVHNRGKRDHQPQRI